MRLHPVPLTVVEPRQALVEQALQLTGLGTALLAWPVHLAVLA